MKEVVNLKPPIGSKHLSWTLRLRINSSSHLLLFLSHALFSLVRPHSGTQQLLSSKDTDLEDPLDNPYVTHAPFSRAHACFLHKSHWVPDHVRHEGGGVAPEREYPARKCEYPARKCECSARGRWSTSIHHVSIIIRQESCGCPVFLDHYNYVGRRARREWGFVVLLR